WVASDPRPPRPMLSQLAPPKIPQGGRRGFGRGGDIHRKRMEKDLLELQTLIDAHFEQRRREEEELQGLMERIERRRAERKEQLRSRTEKERERQARLAVRATPDPPKAPDLAPEAPKVPGFGPDSPQAEQRRGRRQTGREMKLRILAERRRPLDIEGLREDGLRAKAEELHAWIQQLESEKFDLSEKLRRQRYEVGTPKPRKRPQNGPKTPKRPQNGTQIHPGTLNPPRDLEPPKP
uniref:Troponin T, slow skeletal muscle n=1 Tax=Geospiza parvula TaxID=87175 RepID=A0A8U8BKU8_GEOPR